MSQKAFRFWYNIWETMLTWLKIKRERGGRSRFWKDWGDNKEGGGLGRLLRGQMRRRERSESKNAEAAEDRKEVLGK